MKKIYLIVFILTMGGTIYGQEENEEPYESSSDTSKPVRGFPFDVFIGKKYYQNSFYKQLTSLDKPSLLEPVTFIGLGYNGGFVVSRGRSYYGHLALVYIIPQKIVLDTNIGGKISGYVFSVSVAGWDLFEKKKNFDLIVSSGANLGRLRILENELLKQKNPILAPMISLAPLFRIGKIKLTLNLQYDYDLSGKSWRRMAFNKTDKILLNKFNQSGISAFLCIGMNLD